MPSFAIRKHWGLAWGALLATVFTVLLVFSRIVGLAYEAAGGTHAQLIPVGDLPFFRLILSYILGGLLAGIVLQWLWVRVRNPFRAALVGFVATLPFFFAMRMAVLGLTGWNAEHVLRVALPALVSGTVVGFLLWSRSSQVHVSGRDRT